MFRSEKIRKILRCAAFLCILALLAHGEERILNAKGAEDLSSAYFSEPKDSHDIIMLGPSTIMNGVYPLLLWNRYGYTAYNLGAVSARIIWQNARSARIIPGSSYWTAVCSGRKM